MSESIFDMIIGYLDSKGITNEAEAVLGDDFSLPQPDTKGIPFAAGAWDGISIYHMSMGSIDEKDIEEIGAAVRLASQGDFARADEAFATVCNRIRMVCMIDDMQHYIGEHSNELDIDNIYRYALHLMLESPDIECVKAGMMIMEIFDMDDDVKGLVRLLGLSDEFTLYAVFLMRAWENGQTEIMNLAKKVNGWGKVHAVNFIEPETDEIKHWLLTDAVSNGVMPAYSGLNCFEKADVESLLDKESLSYEEIAGILAIVDAMLNEGPVQGISALEDPEAMLVKVLRHASEHLPLQPQEAESIYYISDWQEEHGEDDNPDIEYYVDAILCNPKTRELIAQEVKKGKYISLAAGIGLPYKEELFAAMEKNFDKLYGYCSWLMDDDNYVDAVLDLFRKHIDVENLNIQPDDTPGLRTPVVNMLNFIVQELKDKPGKGDDFVEAALRSPVIGNKNGALNVLEAWVEDADAPLSVASPAFHQILIELVDAEVDGKVKERMIKLV